MTGKSLDILVPTRNRPVRLTGMLSTIAAQELPPDLQINLYLLDNSETSIFADFDVARQLDVLEVRGIRTHYLRRPHKKGIYSIRRELYETGTGEFVFYVDDDVTLAPGTLVRLYEGIESLGFTLAASLLIDLDGFYDEEITFSHQVAATLTMLADSVEREHLAAVGSDWMEVFLPQGTNLMFARETFDKQGGWAMLESFFADNPQGWSEDIGLVLALKTAGEAFVDITHIAFHLTPRTRTFGALDIAPALRQLLVERFGATLPWGIPSARRGSGDERALTANLRRMAEEFMV